MLAVMHAQEPEAEELESSLIRGLKRTEFEHLVERGAFEDEGVELLFGQIVLMNQEGEPHAETGNYLYRRLVRAFDDHEFELRYSAPLAADDRSQPQPDIYVGKPNRERGVRPEPSQTLLLIEVSDASIRKDRGIKARLYAKVGIQEYWIVDISGDAPIVEVYTDPDPPRQRYGTIRRYRDGDVIRPKLVPIDIAVADLPR